MPYLQMSIVLLLAAATLAGQVPGADRANPGRAAYMANCASCHLPNLSGRNEAPQLAGGNFMAAWGGRTVGELAKYMQETMPPGNPGGLGAEAYQAVAGFILEANGAKPGSATSSARIGGVANGQM